MLIQSTLIALGATLVAAVQPLEVKDNYFFNPKTGNKFQIVGVAYQPGGASGYDPALKVDPLSDKDVCMRDAALLQILGANAIRVYNLNPALNHDECASIFNAAGIYMLLDVNSPLVGESLTSWNPWESYYAAYLKRTFAVVEAFKDYPNTLAFFSGNEVINNLDTGATVPPYSRAVTRDLKNYVAKHCSRPIPVGYSAADVREVLFDTFNYFACSEKGEENDMSRADIFALNSYSWCGKSNFKEAGYDALVKGFSSSSIPIFFSEFGCNTPSPRAFTEVAAIYGPEMTNVFAGGVVYEYTQEANNYGLVDINKDGSITLRSDFISLKEQYAKLDFAAVQDVKAPTGKAPTPPVCDSKLIQNKGFNNNFTLPVLPPGAQELIDGGIDNAPVGKLVEIDDWNVKQKVQNPDGSILTGLSVKKVDGSNRPGTNTAETGPAAPVTTEGSKNAGNKLHTTWDYVCIGLVSVGCLLLLG